MARSRKWSLVKTTVITALCGAGHVLSSIILGIIGIALGISINKLGAIESFRGGIAAWLIIAFGVGYFVWGLFMARRNRPHVHWHAHEDMSSQIHKHTHSKDHLHVHKGESAKNLTPWILFTIFVFGPCEPLIPLLMYPAQQKAVSLV
jgi:sulfite exporter TauE/SafE